MEKATHYFARQPIVDGEAKTFGFEFFYRDNIGQSVIDDPRAATASVLVSLLNQVGLHAAAGDKKIFVNIDPSILLIDLLLSAPAEKFVFELNADISLGSKERDVLKTLHAEGYRFALQSVTPSSDVAGRLSMLLPYIDFIKVNASATDMDLLPQTITPLRDKQLIAERIEIEEVFEAYKTLGFDYFQGYYFETPTLIEHNRIDPKHLGVVKIYNMLLSDIPMEQVAKELKNHNELTMQLLQYLNSTSMKNAFPNRSIEEIIHKVGKEQLKQWLSLIIFSKSTQAVDDAKSPLSKLMEQRIDIMHYTISALQIEDKQFLEHARLTAFLSLMEPVLGVPLTDVLEQLSVDQSIEDALLHHTGRLGDIYALTLALEKNDNTLVRRLMNALGLEPDMLPRLKNLIKM